jgi:5'-methylthioadenosine phosphorylase
MAREMTFFCDGIVAHISFSQPICPALRNVLYQACKDLGIKAHNGGTYVNIEGPAFSTKAESFLYKKWGMDVVGMTNLPEAKLAREAEICFAAITTVTDYDCWKEEEEEVTVEMILANLRKNTENTKSIIYEVIDKMPSSDECNCRNALKDTIITPAEAIPESTKKKLDIIIGKYIK